jgi:hypothetical protein
MRSFGAWMRVGRANYLWRLFATGLSFFLFGAVGLLFWGLSFPLMRPFLG